MSFDQLMQHALELQRKAIRKASEEHGLSPGNTALIPPGEVEPRRRIAAGFADIPDIFQPFAEMPSPSSFDGIIREMEEGLKKLCRGQDMKDPINGNVVRANKKLDYLSGTESYIENWSGRAAMNFKSRFIDPFPSIVQNQFIIASVLKGALEAQREIWKKARNDIDKIAHDGLEALDRMDDCGKTEWTMTFTVVGAVAAIGAVPLTGGASLAITAVGAASTVMAAAAPDDPPSVRFGGETAEAVIAQVREATTVLVEQIQHQELKIAAAMRGTHNLLAADRESFVANRPELADATVDTITGPKFMGYSS